jgi:hypothetical protein
MGMIHKVLSPGVKNADEADSCAEMLWIIGEFHKCFGGTAKQESVHDLLIHDDKGIQL